MAILLQLRLLFFVDLFTRFELIRAYNTWDRSSSSSSRDLVVHVDDYNETQEATISSNVPSSVPISSSLSPTLADFSSQQGTPSSFTVRSNGNNVRFGACREVESCTLFETLADLADFVSNGSFTKGKLCLCPFAYMAGTDACASALVEGSNYQQPSILISSGQDISLECDSTNTRSSTVFYSSDMCTFACEPVVFWVASGGKLRLMGNNLMVLTRGKAESRIVVEKGAAVTVNQVIFRQ
jgi:hypothetical protein